METRSPSPRAAARCAHRLAIARGDDRLRQAALADYVRHRWGPFVITIVDRTQADAFLTDWQA
jgi:hypothetical protein